MITRKYKSIRVSTVTKICLLVILLVASQFNTAGAQTETPVSIYPVTVGQWYPITITGAISTNCYSVYVSLYQFDSHGQKVNVPIGAGQAIISQAQVDWTWYFSAGGYDNGIYGAEATATCQDGPHSVANDYAVKVEPVGCSLLACVPVYRFYNTVAGSHFYTTSENERRLVLTYPQYRYESIGFYANDPAHLLDGHNMVPVHRFFNKKSGTHFYTANQAEATYVNDQLPSIYRYEGIAYYAFPSEYIASFAPNFSAPLHRFFNLQKGTHFYTASQSEATFVNNYQYSTYRYEGQAYWIIVNKPLTPAPF